MWMGEGSGPRTDSGEPFADGRVRPVLDGAVQLVQIGRGELLVRNSLVVGEHVAELKRIDEMGDGVAVVGGLLFAVVEQLLQLHTGMKKVEAAQDGDGALHLRFANDAALPGWNMRFTALVQCMEQQADIVAFHLFALGCIAIQHHGTGVAAVGHRVDDGRGVRTVLGRLSVVGRRAVGCIGVGGLLHKDSSKSGLYA